MVAVPNIRERGPLLWTTGLGTGKPEPAGVSDLPGLLGSARRNVGRGASDIALFETGRVFLPSEDLPPARNRRRWTEC